MAGSVLGCKALLHPRSGAKSHRIPPTDRKIALLGKLQTALIGRGLPVCGDASARTIAVDRCRHRLQGDAESTSPHP